VSVIESEDYGKTRALLKRDPIIKAMANEITLTGGPVDAFAHESGTPKFPFMKSALDEYHKRGGKVETHIGGPAEAILELLKEDA
jgi:hypothetical protein